MENGDQNVQRAQNPGKTSQYLHALFQFFGCHSMFPHLLSCSVINFHLCGSLSCCVVAFVGLEATGLTL